jgi:hypothetical protein
MAIVQGETIPKPAKQTGGGTSAGSVSTVMLAVFWAVNY